VVSGVKLELVDPKARVWTVTVGADGKLRCALDPKRVAKLKLAA
jgi:hypothetical protein